MSAFFVRFTFITGLILLLGPTLAAADSNNYPPGTPMSQMSQGGSNPFPWTDDSFRPCGQSCSYEKANENIILQILYGTRKIEEIEKITDNDKQETAIRENLHYFCLAGEDPKKCFNRYKATQFFVLNQARKNIIQNEDSAAKLSSIAGQTTWVRYANLEKKNAQLPYIPTYQEMEKYYQDMNDAARSISKEKYAEWADSVYQTPREEDFMLWKEVPKDGRLPNGQKVTIMARTCQDLPASLLQSRKVDCRCMPGKPDKMGKSEVFCYDNSKLADARDKFKNWKEKEALEHGVPLVGRNESEMILGKNPSAYLMLPPKKPGIPIASSPGDISIKAYRDARNAMVQALNEELGKGPQTQTRKVASTPGKVPQSGTLQQAAATGGQNTYTFGDTQGANVKTKAAQPIPANVDLVPVPDPRPASDRDDVFVTITPEQITQELDNINFK